MPSGYSPSAFRNAGKGAGKKTKIGVKISFQAFCPATAYIDSKYRRRASKRYQFGKPFVRVLAHTSA